MVAERLALARSFYSWISSIGIEESWYYVQKKVPDTFPTSLDGLRLISNSLREELQGTKYQERAQYWSSLFEDFMDEELNESYLQKFYSFMRSVFLPPKAVPGDNALLGRSKGALGTLLGELRKIEGYRRESWPYKKFRNMYKERDLDVLANSMDKTLVDIEDDTEENRKGRYKRRIFFYSFWPNMPKFFRLVGATGSPIIEYAIAMIVYSIKSVFGERVAENVYNEAAKNAQAQ